MRSEKSMIDKKKLAEILGSEIVGIGPAQILPADTVLVSQPVVLNEYQVGRLLRYMQGSDYENSEISLQWRTEGDCGPGVYFWEFDDVNPQFLPHESLLVSELSEASSYPVDKPESKAGEKFTLLLASGLNQGVLVRIYNAGYAAGHDDTVEGGFVHVHDQDKATYHEYRVQDLIEEFCRVANNGQ
jgi:hypothetical protein